MAKDTYEVGYKKPPVATKFKKGKSGNPSGRPKGSRNKKTFHPLDVANISKFQKQIVDAGYEEIQVVKNGLPVAMNKIDAVLAQLYNKAMNGELGAAKLLLQHTQKSLLDLDMAATRSYEVTIQLRREERRHIFSPPPKPNTFGAFLEHQHRQYSYLFAQREIFGVDAVPFSFENEPRGEHDWPDFNERMRCLYESIGDKPSEIELSEIPTVVSVITER